MVEGGLGGQVAERGMGDPGGRVGGWVPGVEVGVEVEHGDGLGEQSGEGA